MRLLARFQWVLWLLAFPVGGCTEVSTPPDTVQLVRTVLDEFTLEPLEGAAMCHVETDSCYTTDANGSVTLEVPANEEISWTLVKDGYGPILIGGVSAGLFLGPASTTLYPDEFYADQADRLGTGYPFTDTGMIYIFTLESFAGATFNLLDATGRSFYTDEEGNWDADLTETSSFDRGGFSEAGFVEVPPADVQIEVGGKAQSCTVVSGWPGDGNDRIEVPVRAGFITYAVIYCPPPP